MSDLIRIILIMSISGSIIAALLFALKPLVRNRLPKSAQYYLWLVVILALLIPFSKLIILQSDTALSLPTAPIQEAVERTFTSTQQGFDRGYTLIPGTEPNKPIQPEPTTEDIALSLGFYALTALTYLYPLGIIIALLYFVISYSTYTKLYRRRNVPPTVEENDLLAKLCGNHHAPQLYRNPLAATPMLIGVFRPAIILPDREYTDEQLHAVLLHELTHLRRKDVLVKWLSVVVAALHWFNPIVWLVRREIDRACELSCDEAVIRNLDTDGKQIYGETLLYVAADAKTPHAVLSTTMCEEKKALKERLGAIMKSKNHTRLAIVVSVILLVVVGVTAIALGAGKDTNNHDLIEMEAEYSDMTDYSDSLHIKWGERVYSSDVVYGGSVDGNQVGKQIGVLYDDNGYLGKIYERIGISTDRNLIFRYDNIMSTYDLFVADANYLTLAEVQKMNGRPYPKVRQYLGEPDGVLSGFWGDIYELVDGRQAIIYYGSNTLVENIVVSESETQDFSNRTVTKEEYYHFDSIVANEAVNIGKIQLSNGAQYSITMTTESGKTLFAALNQSPDIREYKGVEWTQFMGRGDSNALSTTFGDSNAGLYYVYVGSTNEVLTNVNVTITITPNDNLATTMPTEIPTPMQIVYQELLDAGYKIEYIFLMSVGDRKSLQGDDNGELATVYTSYTEGEYGDAIYCMRYDFERPSKTAQWTHNEPIYWDGIALDVAAYVARTYYSERYGANYGSLVVTWAGTEEAERLFPDMDINSIAAFTVGTGEDVPSSIILTSADGQSHWKVIGFEGTDVTQ